MSFIERFPVDARRSVLSSVLNLPLPSELRERQEGIEKAEQYLKQGYGLIGFTTHFSYGDFIRVIGAIWSKSDEFRKRKVLIPLALHQRDKLGLKELCRLANIDTSLIVTRDTKKKEQNLAEQDKPIPWEEHGEGFGTKEYLERAAGLLK